MVSPVIAQARALRHTQSMPDRSPRSRSQDKTSTDALTHLRETLLDRFPDSVGSADAVFAQRWEEAPLHGSWLTCFAGSTAKGMRQRDESLVAGHLDAMSEAYNNGSADLRALIDINYMEDLFYNVDVASSRWGWRHVLLNLKPLYTSYWNSVVPRYVSRLEDEDTTAG